MPQKWTERNAAQLKQRLEAHFASLKPQRSDRTWSPRQVEMRKTIGQRSVARMTTHGRSRSPEYRSFRNAQRRCSDPTHLSWKYYGGRGIEFRFTSFEQFFAELGQRPAGMTLDRIDSAGHYEPGNVRWASPSQQNDNRRSINRRDALETVRQEKK